MINFKIFGIRIEISFLLICFLNFVLLIYGEFVLFWCVFSALFHECCHLVCLLLFGNMPKSLKFQISGIVLKDEIELSNILNFVVVGAGCAGNFFLFLIFHLIGFKFAAIVNLCLMIFNLLPHEKLDGGQLLSIALQKIDAATGLMVVSLISKLVFVLLLFLSIVFIFKFRNYTLFFFVVMLNFSK